MSTIIQENPTAEITRPKLTATAEDGVLDANFSEVGLADVVAVVFAGPGIGLKVIVNDRLSPVAHNDAVNAVLERLFAKPRPRQYALIKTSDLPGGAA